MLEINFTLKIEICISQSNKLGVTKEIRTCSEWIVSHEENVILTNENLKLIIPYIQTGRKTKLDKI